MTNINTSSVAPIGQHAILEVIGPISAESGDALLGLMKRAALAAGAHIINAHAHGFGEGFGYTGVLILAESHISFHTWPEHNYAALDIFMCGEAKVQKAINIIQNSSGVIRSIVNIFPRGFSVLPINATELNNVAGAVMPEQKSILEEKHHVFNAINHY